jgi:hypothetical protein
MWAVRAVYGGLVLKDYLSKEEATEIAARDLAGMSGGGELLVHDEHGNLQFTHNQARGLIEGDKFGFAYGLSLLTRYKALPSPASTSAVAAGPILNPIDFTADQDAIRRMADPPPSSAEHEAPPALAAAIIQYPEPTGPPAGPPLDRPPNQPRSRSGDEHRASESHNPDPPKPAQPSKTPAAPVSPDLPYLNTSKPVTAPAPQPYLSDSSGAKQRSFFGLLGWVVGVGTGLATVTAFFLPAIVRIFIGGCSVGQSALCNYARAGEPESVSTVTSWIIGGLIGVFIWAGSGDKKE